MKCSNTTNIVQNQKLKGIPCNTSHEQSKHGHTQEVGSGAIMIEERTLSAD